MHKNGGEVSGELMTWAWKGQTDRLSACVKFIRMGGGGTKILPPTSGKRRELEEQALKKIA